MESRGSVLRVVQTNRRPFLRESFQRTLFEITDCDPVRPRQIDAGIPEGFKKQYVWKCLAKHRNERYGSAEALRTELLAWIAQCGGGNWDPDAPLTMESYELGPVIREGAIATLFPSSTAKYTPSSRSVCSIHPPPRRRRHWLNGL